MSAVLTTETEDQAEVAPESPGRDVHEFSRCFREGQGRPLAIH